MSLSNLLIIFFVIVYGTVSGDKSFGEMVLSLMDSLQTSILNNGKQLFRN